MTRRNLLVWLRVPAYIVFTVVQPVIFRAAVPVRVRRRHHTASAGGYVNYLMPASSPRPRHSQPSRPRSHSRRKATKASSTASVPCRWLVPRCLRQADRRLHPDADRDHGDHRRRLRRRLPLPERGRRRDRDGAPRRGVRDCRLLGVGVRGLAIKDEESVQAFGLIWVFR